MGLADRFKRAVNVFAREPTQRDYYDTGPGYSYRPDRVRFSRGNERSIVTSVYNRIALDASAINMRHVILDNEGRYKQNAEDGLHNCLNLEANQANQRKKDLEMQLSGSKYGIAYIDAAEKVTQLNRSVDNNLMTQIEYLTNLLFSQLGITQSILDGTADEKTMLNYYNRTIEPIVSAIVDEMKRKFLTKTARSKNHSIQFFRDPFKLVPVNDIAEIADKFTRNEIMTKNEMRQIIGMKPSDDPKADELRNANLSEPKTEQVQRLPEKPKEEIQNG